MPRPKTIFLIGVLLFLSIASFVLAAETITIDTYYPSPYGTYNMLRLYPRNDINPSSPCSNAGEMFYHSDDKLVYFCDGEKWVPGFRGNDLSRRIIYDTPGIYTYTVPPGVTQIKVQVWGGGGEGGGDRFGFGMPGGNSSFSTFLTAYGGQMGAIPSFVTCESLGGSGGGYSSAGSSIGEIGQNGQNGNPAGPCGGRGGDAGGSGGLGGAGCPFLVEGTPPGGGGGGAPNGQIIQCPTASSGGGGGGGYVEDTFSVTPGTNYTITVGAGGDSATVGAGGGDGRVIVWY